MNLYQAMCNCTMMRDPIKADVVRQEWGLVRSMMIQPGSKLVIQDRRIILALSLTALSSLVPIRDREIMDAAAQAVAQRLAENADGHISAVFNAATRNAQVI